MALIIYMIQTAYSYLGARNKMIFKTMIPPLPFNPHCSFQLVSFSLSKKILLPNKPFTGLFLSATQHYKIFEIASINASAEAVTTSVFAEKP